MKIIKQNYKKPFLIAEIGINHNGSIDNAKKLIDLAKACEFNAVKFQKRNPDISIPKDQKNKLRQTPWGEMTYLDYKKKIEFGKKEFNEIDRYCKRKKIFWFASAWDVESVDFLKRYKLRYNKVASAMIKNIELLKKIASEKKLTFISTGMCNLKDIQKCIKIFKEKKCKFILMHCVSNYPCPLEDLNLNMIPVLKKKFKCEIGYSGHESHVSPSIMAYFLGARYIERHITLDRSMWGTDQAASLAENGMRTLSNILNKTNKVLGDGIKKISKREKELIKKFRYWD